MRPLACSVPFALEGLLRREIERAGASTLDVAHGSVVTLRFALPEPEAATFEARINEIGQGRVRWLSAED